MVRSTSSSSSTATASVNRQHSQGGKVKPGTKPPAILEQSRSGGPGKVIKAKKSRMSAVVQDDDDDAEEEEEDTKKQPKKQQQKKASSATASVVDDDGDAEMEDNSGEAVAKKKPKFKRLQAVSSEQLAVDTDPCMALAAKDPADVAASFIDEVPADLADVFEELKTLEPDYYHEKTRNVLVDGEPGSKDSYALKSTNPLRTYARNVTNVACEHLIKYDPSFGEGRIVYLSKEFVDAVTKIVHVHLLRQIRSARAIALRRSHSLKDRKGNKLPHPRAIIEATDAAFAGKASPFIRQCYSLQKDESMNQALQSFEECEASLRDINRALAAQLKMVNSIVRNVDEAIEDSGKSVTKQSRNEYLAELDKAIREHTRSYNMATSVIKTLCKACHVQISEAGVSMLKRCVRNTVSSLVKVSIGLALTERSNTLGPQHLVRAVEMMSF